MNAYASKLPVKFQGEKKNPWEPEWIKVLVFINSVIIILDKKFYLPLGKFLICNLNLPIIKILEKDLTALWLIIFLTSPVQGPLVRGMSWLLHPLGHLDHRYDLLEFYVSQAGSLPSNNDCLLENVNKRLFFRIAHLIL